MSFSSSSALICGSAPVCHLSPLVEVMLCFSRVGDDRVYRVLLQRRVQGCTSICMQIEIG